MLKLMMDKEFRDAAQKVSRNMDAWSCSDYWTLTWGFLQLNEEMKEAGVEFNPEVGYTENPCPSHTAAMLTSAIYRH